MKLKISFHNQPENFQKFIVTYSSYNDKKTLIEHLKEDLIKLGYQLEEKSDKDIYLRLRDTSEDNYFSRFIDRILIPFISIFKGNNYDESSFELLRKNMPEKLSDKLEIIEQFYLYYQKTLKEQNRVDFEDMINIAYKVMPSLKEANLGVDYNYIIIDEYQDISMQRYNLTKRISDLFDAKIIAVGDDFQSIFGFAGADVELFTNFKKYLDSAKMIPIVNTYRNSQELVDLASDFVLKNNQQIKKRLVAHKSIQKPVEIYLYDDSKRFLSDYSKPLAVSKIIGEIYCSNPTHNILLLGRYKDDINTLLKSGLFVKLNKENIICKNYPKAKIDFLTVHSAKGLGYDQCILINSSNEKFGFPSLIEDEPIISILKPKREEEIPYSEERRLFYVALTRTKNKMYIVTPSTHISPFIEEIRNDNNVLYHDTIIRCNSKIMTNYDCPRCHSDKLIMFNYKKSDYWLYECKNCYLKTSMPKKGIPIRICPKCGEILIYIYKNRKTNNYILRCFNESCNYFKKVDINDSNNDLNKYHDNKIYDIIC